MQLTGRYNYQKFGKELDIPLVENPDFACAPEIAGCLLAAYLNANREKLTRALAENKLKAARKVVNGGSHGLDRFTETFRMAQLELSAARSFAGIAPIEALPNIARRAALNVTRDVTDLRDRLYMPPPRSLPRIFPADEDVKVYLGGYTRAGLILDQGREGACTGFGLACVINYLRWHSAGMPKEFESASPRMLYKFARKYDEYEDENYDGSSCWGALKGWYHNGVCLESKWPYASGENSLPDPGWDSDVAEHTLGVYYRIDPKGITDVQAALQEVGAIFVSCYTHQGWEKVTLDGVTRTLRNQACVLPDSWFRHNGHQKKRLVLFAYGGFSDWVSDKIGDQVSEKTIGRSFARPIWSEMKENAELASASGRGGDLLIDALHSLAGSWEDNFELHLIGHSAGSIILGRLLGRLAQKDLIDCVGSVHLYAPACTVAFANRYYATQPRIMTSLYLDILSDAREQEDNVAQMYRKSLLYFVANALEADVRMPILGLANVYDANYSGWDGSSRTAETLTNWRSAVEICKLPKRLAIHNEEKILIRRDSGTGLSEKWENASYGGFDNNVAILNKTLERIIGAPLVLPVDDLVGF